MKTRRKSITQTTSPTRRSKSSAAAAARDLASTPSTQIQPKPTPQPVNPEPRELTLSERLASIGRITSTVDQTNNENEETKN